MKHLFAIRRDLEDRAARRRLEQIAQVEHRHIGALAFRCRQPRVILTDIFKKIAAPKQTGGILTLTRSEQTLLPDIACFLYLEGRSHDGLTYYGYVTVAGMALESVLAQLAQGNLASALEQMQLLHSGQGFTTQTLRARMARDYHFSHADAKMLFV